MLYCNIIWEGSYIHVMYFQTYKMIDETPEQLKFHNSYKTSMHTPIPALRTLKS